MAVIMIKNMVCKRCILAVEHVFRQHDIPICDIRLGEVMMDRELAQEERLALSQSLKDLGFEILSDRRSLVVERIKVLIVELVRKHDAFLDIPLSVYLSRELNADYSGLSQLFSHTEGITIERFFILQRIERVKELVSYGELSLSEIADKLHFSSVAHMSTQFKRATGVSPSSFKGTCIKERQPLDEIV